MMASRFCHCYYYMGTRLKVIWKGFINLPEKSIEQMVEFDVSITGYNTDEFNVLIKHVKSKKFRAYAQAANCLTKYVPVQVTDLCPCELWFLVHFACRRWNFCLIKSEEQTLFPVLASLQWNCCNWWSTIQAIISWRVVFCLYIFFFLGGGGGNKFCANILREQKFSQRRLKCVSGKRLKEQGK